ncbi:hypothetical protein FIBSPDRAFT_915338 [Athelia psychrophila]|uniref:Uncharacterized protein n=1 Tax=Athelia psychrophila TaxID=1759441 RepID=A0A167TU63_9AGAM|nr:hypothetical protein FIBSPDRAFT_915338 [Fibularhizoctonia sp. CBS 109695]
MVIDLQSLPMASFNNPSCAMLGLLNAIRDNWCLRRAGCPFAPHAVLIGAPVDMTIGARFSIGMGPFAANAAHILLTSAYNSLWYSRNILADLWHVQDQQNLVLVDPLDSSWIAECVADWSREHPRCLRHVQVNTWSLWIPSILQGLPSVLRIYLVWFVPEPPRCLVSKGRDAQMLHILALYRADGDDDDGLLSCTSLFATPGNEKHMRIIVALACTLSPDNGLFSYHLNEHLISGLRHRQSLRALLASSGAGMSIVFLAQMICIQQYQAHQKDTAAHGMIAFICLVDAAYDLAFTPLIVSYSVEILRYHLRMKEFNTFNDISLVLIFNRRVTPIALATLRWKYYDGWLTPPPLRSSATQSGSRSRAYSSTSTSLRRKIAALFDAEEAVERLEPVGYR